MTSPNKINQSDLNKRYTISKNYSIIRFFSNVDPNQKYLDIKNLIAFIVKRKIDIDTIDYEIKIISVRSKIKRGLREYYFSARDDDGEEYLNVYSSSFHDFNDFSDAYYQWVNLKTGCCFIGAQFVLSCLNTHDEKIESLAKKILNEKTLVL